MKVLVEVKPKNAETSFFLVLDEDEAEKVMDRYAPRGWDFRVVTEFDGEDVDGLTETKKMELFFRLVRERMGGG